MAVDARTLRVDLDSISARWRDLDPESDAGLAVDGVLPSVWCEPGTLEEMGEVVRVAHAHGASVIPRGGGTRMALGMPPRTADLLLSTLGLSRIIEYEPADLTITVEAGVRLGELQQRLSAEGQLLALDPPSADRATIGGVVASNASGPMRLQYGAARDLVIGTRVVNADGVITKAGGRVVKNVAGYDLNKLYTGSLGTLGVIVELSFKLHPLPRSRGTVLASFDDLDSAARVVSKLMRSPLGPSAIEVLDDGAATSVGTGLSPPADGCLLAVLAGGFERAVERVTREIADYCREENGVAEIRQDDDETQVLWSTLRGLADASNSERPVLKLAVPPSRSLEAFGALRAGLRSGGLAGALVAHAGVGLVYAGLKRAEWNEDELSRLAGLVAETRGFAREREGSLVVESGPAALKQRIEVWGEVGPALRLMMALKEKLDPASTLNPGRFVGGI